MLKKIFYEKSTTDIINMYKNTIILLFQQLLLYYIFFFLYFLSFSLSRTNTQTLKDFWLNLRLNSLKFAFVQCIIFNSTVSSLQSLPTSVILFNIPNTPFLFLFYMILQIHHSLLKC